MRMTTTGGAMIVMAETMRGRTDTAGTVQHLDPGRHPVAVAAKTSTGLDGILMKKRHTDLEPVTDTTTVRGLIHAVTARHRLFLVPRDLRPSPRPTALGPAACQTLKKG